MPPKFRSFLLPGRSRTKLPPPPVFGLLPPRMRDRPEKFLLVEAQFHRFSRSSHFHRSAQMFVISNRPPMSLPSKRATRLAASSPQGAKRTHRLGSTKLNRPPVLHAEEHLQ
ncbi:hypothetical protein U9M48_040821, partial [Paspalum notatum var. saurae]